MPSRVFRGSAVAGVIAPHAIGDKVEAAYRRGDLFDKRRRLMAACGSYCIPSTAVAILGSV